MALVCLAWGLREAGLLSLAHGFVHVRPSCPTHDLASSWATVPHSPAAALRQPHTHHRIAAHPYQLSHSAVSTLYSLTHTQRHPPSMDSDDGERTEGPAGIQGHSDQVLVLD